MSTATSGRAREHRTRDRLAERFWAKVSGGDVETCWIWTASVNPHGYGKFFTHKEQGRTILVGAHRWAFEALRGEIPEGLHIDHLCRNRRCVNPWHLEPVTLAENNRRAPSGNGSKTHCKRGHAFTPENTGRQNGGFRYCRTCKQMTDARRAA